MSKRSPALDAALMGELSKRAAETARNHLNAAKCLLDGRFWPQAYALAAIGLEETGKAWLAALEMLSPDELRELTPIDLGRDHVRKLSAAYSMLLLLRFAAGTPDAPSSAADALASLNKLAIQANVGKQRGLYTDYRDARVRTPSEVTEQEAREMVTAVDEVLDSGGALVDMATAIWAKDTLPDEARSFMARAVEAAKTGGAAVEAFIQAELGAINPLAEVLMDDPVLLQLIKDEPGWVASILHLASDASLPTWDRSADKAEYAVAPVPTEDRVSNSGE
jgi:AbiV family abortive infection protein